MDPLSITASSIALAHVIHLSIKGVSAFRRADPDLVALYNEISDLLTVLYELESVLRIKPTGTAEAASIIGISDVIANIKIKLELLSTQVSKWSQRLQQSNGSPPGSARRRLGAPYHARKFKEEFRSLRDRLSSYLAVLGISSTSRIELELREVLLLAKRTDEAQQSIKTFLETSTAEIPRDLRNSGSTSSGDEDSIAPAASTECANPLVEDEDTVIDLGSTRAFKHNGKILFDSKQLTAISAIGIRTAQFPRTACVSWCSCCCHSESRIETPKILQGIFGRLFIGYSGIPVLTKPCNQQPRCQRAQPLSYVTYFFPPWFLARMVSLMFTTTSLAGPVVSLKVQRTVPGNADIFMHAKLGNVNEIHKVFESGLASPHDVHYDSGVTALHLALSHKRVAVCKYLLDMNADPFLEDRKQRAAADSAWDKILMKAFPPELERTFRLMFSETECIQRREFTTIHKIVLGLASGDLSALLSLSTTEVNIPDVHGRTPIALAAALGDQTSIKTLLAHSADVNIATTIGGTPLHFAAHNKDPACIPLLIRAGAFVDACTDWRQTPLIFAAAYSRDPRHAERLLDAGASINLRDLDGITALGWSAIVDNGPVAKLLLGRGADITNVDCNGDTVISLCITSNRFKILELFREGVFNHSQRKIIASATKDLLLLVAANATLETMHAVEQLQLQSVETDATNTDGKTWSEILNERSDCNEALRHGMNRLVDSYKATSGTGTMRHGEDPEDDAYFVDALEFQ